mmetsp:Transcript_48654/g.135995  ORF Transcript_48654/g.135995 Transcript_48654/m.135995 type:complete len:462 (+) Transcript_48654:31-1416(+)
MESRLYGSHEQDDKQSHSGVLYSVAGFLVCAVGFVHGATFCLLPACFRALEVELGISPILLAQMQMSLVIFTSVAAPLWATLIDKGASGKAILIAGASSWGVCSALLAFASSVPCMLGLLSLSGLSLATVTPAVQVMVATSTETSMRGRAFGVYGVANSLGGVVFGLFATSISNMDFGGIMGWRIVLFIAALCSLVLAAVLSLFMPDHRREWVETSAPIEYWAFSRYFRAPTFSTIILQGCFGSVPWSSMEFLTIFFQYCGIDDFSSALLRYGVLGLTTSAGYFIGGVVGDKLTAYSRFHGRPFTAQISVGLSIPLIFILLHCVPANRSSYGEFCLILAVFGATATWCKYGVNSPILSEIVPQAHLARIAAWDAAFEGVASALFGSVVVGFLAEDFFGYVPERRPMADVPEQIRLTNVHALASGMLWMTLLPWSVCFVVYSTLHFWYQGDVEAAKRRDWEL